jgi:hypothetical protein
MKVLLVSEHWHCCAEPTQNQLAEFLSLEKVASLTDRDSQDRLLLLIPTTSYRVADFLDAAHRLDVAVAWAPTNGTCWKRSRTDVLSPSIFKTLRRVSERFAPTPEITR